jgi:hypothetical protein
MPVPAPTSSEFLESYPEFSKAPAALLTRKLAEAARRTSSTIYTPEQQMDAVCLKAAVLMTKSPEARKMKLVTDDQAFVWGQELYELQRGATMGLRNT